MLSMIASSDDLVQQRAPREPPAWNCHSAQLPLPAAQQAAAQAGAVLAEVYTLERPMPCDMVMPAPAPQAVTETLAVGEVDGEVD